MKSPVTGFRLFVALTAVFASAFAAGCGGGDETGPQGEKDAGPGGDTGGLADGATDAGKDGGTDGGLQDRGPADDTSYPSDTSHPSDASSDAEIDAGGDAGEDAGSDGGPDAGFDAGTEPATLAFFKHPKTTPAGDPIPQIEVVIRDARGRVAVDATNPVTIAIGVNPSGGVLSGTLTANPAAGYAGFGDLSIDKPGTGYTLTASSPGLTGAESREFDVGAGAPAGLAFVVEPSDTAAGAAIAPAVQVAVQDASGSTVTSATSEIEIALDANPGSGALSGVLKVKAVAGIATFADLSIDKAAEGYTLKAASGTLSEAVSATFNVAAGAAAKLGFLSWFPQTAAGDPISPPVRVAVQDALGNTVPDATDAVTVALGANPAGGTLSGTLTLNAQNGVAEFDDLSIDKAGTGYTLSASSGNLTGAEGTAFTIVAGPAANLVFATQPSNAVAGSAIVPAVSVALLDALGNVADGSADAVTIAIAANPAGGTLGGTTTVNAASGVAAFADLSIDKAGAGYTLAASSGTLGGTTSAAFDVSPGAPSAAVSTVAAAPSPLVADGTATATVTVTVRDALGNPVPGQSVQIAATGTANTVVQPASATDASGVATGTIASTRAETKTVTATVNPGAGETVVTQTASVVFSPGAPSASVSTVAANPSSVTADGVATATVTVTVRDANANPLPGRTVEIAATGASNTLTQPSSATNASGVATGTVASTKAEQKTLSAVVNPGAGQVAIGQTASVTFAPGPAAGLGFIVQPANAAAGAAIAPAVQVAVQDLHGNTVPGAADVVSISIGNNPSGGTLSGTAAAAASNGVATFANLSINKAGVGYKLAASAAGLTGTMSAAFDITAGNAVKLGFVVQPSAEVAGDTISPSVQVAVQDLFGNTVPGRTDAVTISFWTNPGGATLNGTATQNAAGGVAVFGDLSITKAAAGYSFAASSGTLGSATSDLFDITHDDPALLTFKTQPANAVAGVAISPAVEVLLFDQYGNLAASAANQVTMSIATGPAGAALSGTKTKSPAGGVAAFGDLRLDKAGAYTLLATAAGVTPTVESNGFTVNPAAASSLKLEAPAGVTAGNAFELTVTANDQYGNVATGYTGGIAFTSADPQAVLPADYTFAAPDAGTHTFGGVSLKTAGSRTVTATDKVNAGITGSASVSVAAAAAAKFAFAVEPSDAAAGTAISPAVQVAVKDQYDNAVTSSTEAITVSIQNNPAGGTLSGTLSKNAAGGVASFGDLSIDKAGSGYALAASGALIGATSGGFDIVPGAPHHLAFTAEPNDAIAGVAIAPAVEVSVYDQFDNFVANATTAVTVAIKDNPGGGALSGTTAANAAGGVASFDTLSIDKAGNSYTLSADAGGMDEVVSATFDISHAEVKSLKLDGPENVMAGDGFDVTVTAQDDFGNTVTDYTGTVTFDSGDPLAELPADYTFVPGDLGVHIVAGFKLKTAGTQLVDVEDTANGTINGQHSVAVDPAPAIDLVFAVQPSRAGMNEVIVPAVEVAARDAFGNVDTNYTIDVTVELAPGAPPGAVLSGTLTVAPAVGVAVFDDLSIDQPGTGFRIRAGSGTLPDEDSGAFDIYGPAKAGNVIISEAMHSPQAAPALGRWFEIRNTAPFPVDIDGMKVSEVPSGKSFTVDTGGPLVIEKEGYFVFAASLNPVENGGADTDYAWPADFTIAATGRITLELGAVMVEDFGWDGTFPQTAGKAMNLSSLILSPRIGHVKPWYWCDATAVYGSGDFGTPGADNDACGVVLAVPPIDWCNIQWPKDIALLPAGDHQDVFSRFWDAPATQRAIGINDFYPYVEAEMGFGETTNPYEPGKAWGFIPAVFNEPYSNPGSNDDETVADLSIGTVGSYRYGFRYRFFDPPSKTWSAWTHCDKNNPVAGEPPISADYGSVTVVPKITGTSHQLLPRGSTFGIDGVGFTGATAVTIGGQAQAFTIDSDSLILIEPVDGATPLGDQALVVHAGAYSSADFTLKVMTLTVDYPVIAHGGRLVATASGGLTGSTAVGVAGADQAFTVDSDTQITVPALDPATPIGRHGLRIETPAGETAPIPVTAIHLAINELDSDTPAVPVNDDHEFIEISTGVPDAPPGGYVLVWWNGLNDLSYRAINLTTPADANGLVLLGNPAVVSNPANQWPNNTLQNGADAVAIYQGTAADFPDGTPIGSVTAPLIDALVYDTADPDDAGLLDALLGGGPQRVQVNEDQGGNGDVNSIRRCGPALRDGREFSLAAPTPGAPNACP
ncbi:MAG: Ig-like domain-containing protein [Deltaproteobacteria bacterium]|nr:Ig-like domain-containing protein [Deltaproteobacteria bacterium]